MRAIQIIQVSDSNIRNNNSKFETVAHLGGEVAVVVDAQHVAVAIGALNIVHLRRKVQLITPLLHFITHKPRCWYQEAVG